MSTIPVTDPHKAWNVKQFKRLEAYNARLQKLLDNAIKKAASIAMRHDANASDEHLFSFSDDRQMKAEADKLMKDLSDEITSFTQSAIGKEWEKALQQATEYIGQIYNLAEQTQNRQDSFLDMMLGMRSRNEDALIEFNKRKIGGLNLSKKVWGYTQDFERQLEVSIDTALMQGMSANNLALSIQSLLKDPDDLFRRVRDNDDKLRLSKAMEAYHPGTGKYRSAYKNALRLARSEINIAYRTSDSNMAQMLDCVVGIQINLSNNHTNNGEPFTDICDQLAGKYPKDFKFVGWHPQCRCFITYILKTDDEFWEDLENGENNKSVNSVDDVPIGFKEWVNDNAERIKTSEKKSTTPYFIIDNESFVSKLTIQNAEVQLNELPSFTISQGGETKRIETLAKELNIDENEAKRYYDVIRAFTGNEYTSIRRYQQGIENSEYLQNHSFILEDFISKAPKWDGGETFRGISLSESEITSLIDSMKTSQPISMKGTASWSTYKDMSVLFAEDSASNSSFQTEKVLFHCSTKQNGTSICCYSKLAQEHEILCSKKCRYIITGYKKENGFNIFEVELI